MYAKGFDAHFVGNFEHHRPENTQRLRALAKSPFRRASTAYPRHVRYHLGMLGHHPQHIVLPWLYVVANIERKSGATAQYAPIRFAIQPHMRISTHAFETYKILLFALQFWRNKLFFVPCIAMQIAMGQLSVSIIIVPIVRYIHTYSIFVHPCFPVFVELHMRATLFYLGCWKAQCRPPHGFACGHGYRPLIVFIYSAIKMIHHTFVLHHIAFVRKQIVVRFRRHYQILAFPVGPVY